MSWKRRAQVARVCLGIALLATACSEPLGSDVPPPTPADFGYDTRPSNSSCVVPPDIIDNATSELERVFANLDISLPVDLRQAPGDPSKWYVVQKGGKVRVFANNNSTSTISDFIDITSSVNSGPSEAGLLSMAFHPDYPTKNYVYLSYTAPSASSNANLRSTIERFTVANDGTVDRDTRVKVFPPNDSSPNVADQPFANHNGGNIAFGTDGFLYFGLGDGGDQHDPDERAQNLDSYFGKLLRIDVDSNPDGARYGIPASNPFVDQSGLDEIYAYGFRNPWRFTFDIGTTAHPGTGELWLGDVGQNLWEEVDAVANGKNYGWDVKEGFNCHEPSSGCSSVGLTDPIVEYSHNGGARSITGGFVYRGNDIPELLGRYIYADEVTGEVFYFDVASPTHTSLLSSGKNISSFAQGLDGELYLLSYGDGFILKLVRNGTSEGPGVFADNLSDTGCANSSNPKLPTSGMIPYDINAPFWSDGASKDRWMALRDGKQITIEEDGDWTLPIGSVLRKDFRVDGKLIETRLFARHPDGNWRGYSYEWNGSETEATLLDGQKMKTVGDQTWFYPSRSDCIMCHTAAAGSTLGLENAQLNKSTTYPATNRLSNQVATLDHISIFAAPLGVSPDTLPSYPQYADTSAPLENRARAYLHANCSHCHRPGGGGQGSEDFRYSVATSMINACDEDPTQGDLGVSGAKLIIPGSPSTSIVSLRMYSLIDGIRMPFLASSVVDPTGTKLIDNWIQALDTCP